MNFNEAKQAINEARETLNRGDYMIRVLAQMMAGRIRKADIGNNTLCALKRELANYNMKTGEWK